ncbi:MAG TPA: hypothetical protein LFW21_07045 [Rickettsia endosymbiont of Pyrocoelia pectoralis]|nr:hypothetical protein [Rickettsia endosymbiont of Pyrocoelia pectoralis]
MTKKYLIILYLIFLPFISYGNPTLWDNPTIINTLKFSKVDKIESMKEILSKNNKISEFDGEVFLITFNNNIKAIFKTVPFDDLGDAYAEAAAYNASQILGFPYIPPTVVRKINGKFGSLQLYIDSSIDLLKKGEYTKALTCVSAEDQANLRIFYYVFGQWDSGPHNLLFTTDQEKDYFIAIDNAGIRNHQHVKIGELPFVRVLYSEKLNTNDWHKPFPFDQAIVIEKPNEENLRKLFKDKLPESFYKNFKSYNSSLKYIIYQNSLWQQYHAFDKDFIKAIPEICPAKTIVALKKLNIQALRRIFIEAKNSDFLTDAYLKAILKRRNDILDYCKTLTKDKHT